MHMKREVSNSTNSSVSHWKLGALRQYALSKYALLDYKIVDAGSYLSQGQKQLICLARALLNRSKIILIDEAIASVDPETKALVYQVIGKVASETQATVLCVCHKLEGVRELYTQVCMISLLFVKLFQWPLYSCYSPHAVSRLWRWTMELRPCTASRTVQPRNVYGKNCNGNARFTPMLDYSAVMSIYV